MPAPRAPLRAQCQRPLRAKIGVVVPILYFRNPGGDRAHAAGALLAESGSHGAEPVDDLGKSIGGGGTCVKIPWMHMRTHTATNVLIMWAPRWGFPPPQIQLSQIVFFRGLWLDCPQPSDGRGRVAVLVGVLHVSAGVDERL